MTHADPRTAYAPVNGLEMYYQIHGAGEPLDPAARRLRGARDVR